METRIANSASVGTLMSQLHAQKTTPRARFKITINKGDVAALLTEAYKQEVEARRRTFTADDTLTETINAVADSLTSTEREKQCKFGMMLYGFMGNGKTTMLRAINRIIGLCRITGNAQEANGTLLIYDASDILKISSNEGNWKDLKDTPFLAIDDFGKEPTEVISYGSVYNPMIELLDYRYRKMLYTIISSNMKPEEVRGKYGQRIADRFNEMLDVIRFKGKTFRR